MTNPLLIKAFTASGSIEARRIVSLESDKDVCQATDESAVNIGVTELACNSGDSVDVILSGLTDVKAGGAIARGDWVASDAEGRAVAVDAESGGAALGVALETAAEGEMVSVAIVPQRAAASGGDSTEKAAAFRTLRTFDAGCILMRNGARVFPAISGSSDIIGVAKTSITAITDKARGDFVDVIVGGIATVVAGEAIKTGARITASSGLAVNAGEYDYVLGIALNDAAANEAVVVLIERDRPRVDQTIPVPEYTATSFPFGDADSNPISVGLIGYLDAAGGVVASMVDITQPPIGVCIDSDGSDIAMATSGVCNVFCRPSGSSSSVNQISVGDYVGAASSTQSFGAVAVSAAGRWYVGKAVAASDSETGLVKVLINPGQIPASS